MHTHRDRPFCTNGQKGVGFLPIVKTTGTHRRSFRQPPLASPVFGDVWGICMGVRVASPLKILSSPEKHLAEMLIKEYICTYTVRSSASLAKFERREITFCRVKVGLERQRC
jgi:hypothetical protein